VAQLAGFSATPGSRPTTSDGCADRRTHRRQLRCDLQRARARFQPFDRLEEMADRAGEAVEPHHDEHIVGLDLPHQAAHFRSLRDPIDTSTPQGMFSLQVPGAVAQLERALISERTKAGIKAARARGNLPGNPGLRERRPEALQKVSAARDQVDVAALLASMDAWLPTVRRMRPAHPWEDVARVLNLKATQPWTVERLRRAVRRLVQEHLAEPHLIERARRKPSEDRLMTLIAGIAMANPDMALRDIAAQLEVMRERTPRGGCHWSASSVKNLLDQARRLGLAMPIELRL